MLAQMKAVVGREHEIRVVELTGPTKGFIWHAGKQTAYETDIHLTRCAGGRVCRTASPIVGNVDLAPTFAALAKVPAFVDAASPVCSVIPSGGGQWRTWYSRRAKERPTLAPFKGARRLKHRPIKPPPRFRQARSATASIRIRSITGSRTERYLYVEYVTGEHELYNVIHDPAELHNIYRSATPTHSGAVPQACTNCKRAAPPSCRVAENQPVTCLKLDCLATTSMTKTRSPGFRCKNWFRGDHIRDQNPGALVLVAKLISVATRDP